MIELIGGKTIAADNIAPRPMVSIQNGPRVNHVQATGEVPLGNGAADTQCTPAWRIKSPFAPK
jgi:hypothetical protein